MRPFCATVPNHHKAGGRGLRAAAPQRLLHGSQSTAPGGWARVLDRSLTNGPGLAPPGATPTTDSQPRRIADFATLGDALDYAAQGRRGLNFHDGRGALERSYLYSELREDALASARRFIALGLEPGDRLALIAETGPEFAAAFFGAIYAGVWPVPLPLPTSFGGREAYVEQLKVQLQSCDPALFLYPAEIAQFAGNA